MALNTLKCNCLTPLDFKGLMSQSAGHTMTTASGQLWGVVRPLEPNLLGLILTHSS